MKGMGIKGHGTSWFPNFHKELQPKSSLYLSCYAFSIYISLSMRMSYVCLYPTAPPTIYCSIPLPIHPLQVNIPVPSTFPGSVLVSTAFLPSSSCPSTVCTGVQDRPPAPSSCLPGAELVSDCAGGGFVPWLLHSMHSCVFRVTCAGWPTGRAISIKLEIKALNSSEVAAYSKWSNSKPNSAMCGWSSMGIATNSLPRWKYHSKETAGLFKEELMDIFLNLKEKSFLLSEWKNNIQKHDSKCLVKAHFQSEMWVKAWKSYKQAMIDS